jgi:DegV family protein with EDD domain
MSRVVTDGAADLPPEVAARLAITVVRGRVRFDGELWTGEPVEFWSRLRGGGALPATDAPSADDLAEAIAGGATVGGAAMAGGFAGLEAGAAGQRVGGQAVAGQSVFSLHVSSELSRTVAHAQAAAQRSSSVVHVVDTRSLSVGTGLVAMAIAEACQAGTSEQRLLEMVQTCVDQVHVHAVIDDVDYLVRGGRAGLVAAKIGRHNRRHVVALKGHVVPIRQVRRRADAMRELVGHVREHAGGGVSRWAVAHGDSPDVDEVVQRLAGTLGSDPVYVTLLGAPVGAHLGPGSVVVGFLSDS